MSCNGGRDKGFQQKSHVKDANVVVGKKPGLQVYDELEVSKVDENVTGGRDDLVVVGHHQNIVSQGSLVHWERFLHVDSIKVMLVENDDCTRHIVTALLRNCNYQVIEASNGFQAWKILENLSNHIDIVLTEVVMPSYSGVGLLCKIMSHKTRKNIPVIMMSSNDSMGLVFKCLTKGAVDFLLKPIRKNELKNLWQHVWRRCHSSSGSGSESGTNGQKSVNSKRSESDDSISIVGDDDDGCGTRSSWTKQAVEVESPQAVSPCDSTCGLVIHSDEIPATIDLQGQDGNFSEYVTTKGIELETGGSKDSKKVGEIEVVKEPKNILETNTKVMDDSRGTLTELSLKRPREVNQGQNGHNVLGHSEPSAFTSYNTISKQAVTGKSDDDPKADLVGPPQVHHIHHHHHVHHYHNMGSNQPPDSHKDSGVTKAPHCGSSNVLGGGGVEGKIGNCSLNGSGSGSKHGSNVAALMKFPEKRKGRRLQKKVRYQNRKQNVGESSSNGEDG